MTDDDLRREVRDLIRYRFAGTPDEVAQALGIDPMKAAKIWDSLVRKPASSTTRTGRILPFRP